MNPLVKAEGGQPGQVSATSAQEQSEPKQYLTFVLGGELFSISILCIKEIIWYTELTEVPMMPACIRGVINLRGAVVPVMDLSARFGKPPNPVTKNTCIVIIEIDSRVEGQRQHMGVVVDAVQAVLEIPPSEIEPPPTFGTKIRSDFIEGIGKVNGKFVVLLNVNQVLSTEEIGAMSQVVESVDVGQVVAP